MTRSEWLSCDDPQAMLNLVRGKANDRKSRLFVAAYVRSVFWFLTPEHAPEAFKAVEVAERFADESAAWVEVEAARHDAEALADAHFSGDLAVYHMAKYAAVANSTNVLYALTKMTEADYRGRVGPNAGSAINRDRTLRLSLIRDIFHPFSSAMTPVAGQTQGITSLVRDGYVKRSFECLPKVADALENGGCTDTDLLKHCRQAGPHVRGCWAADLILSKPTRTLRSRIAAKLSKLLD